MDELHYNTAIKMLISHDFPINRVPYIPANSLHSPLDSVPWEQDVPERTDSGGKSFVLWMVGLAFPWTAALYGFLFFLGRLVDGEDCR